MQQATATVARTRPGLLLDRWAGQLLRGGARRRDTFRSPMDVARIVAALLFAGLAWWLGAGLDRAAWPQAWEWVQVTLVAVALLGLAGGCLVVLVLAVHSRRVLLAVAASAGLIGGVVFTIVLANGSAAPAIAWAVGIAAGTAIWPACLTSLRRALIVGELAALALLLGHSNASTGVLLATAAVGYAAGCAWRLLAGRDVDDVTASEVVAYAAELGVPLDDVVRAATAGAGMAHSFSGRCGSQDVTVSVYGRSSVDAHLLKGLGRIAWYRNARMPVPVTRLQHLEHHVALVLRGTTAGIASVRILAAGLAGPADDAVLITSRPPARELAELSADEAVPLLAGLWSTVRAMSEAGIAHGCIDTSTLAVSSDGWVVTDLPGGTLVGTAVDAVADRAAALAATASVVGNAAAVAAMREAFDDSELAAVVPLLQRASLPPTLRGTRKSAASLAELREALAAASGTEQGELATVHRVSASSLVLAAGTLLGVWLLIGQLSGYGDVGQQLLAASWWWIAAAFVVGLLPNGTEAIALSGAVAAPLRLGPLVLLRLADGFFGLVGGTVATTAASVRYFQKEGLGASIAVSSGVLYSLAGFADQVVLSAIALWFSWDAFSLSAAQSGASSGTSSSGHGDLLLILLLALVAIGVVVGILALRPRFRRLVADKAKPQVDLIRGNLRDIAGQPGRLRRLFGANLLTQILFAITLGLCLHAYGGSAPIGVLILVNTAASLLGGLAPVPGGMGVMEGAIITGLLAAGVPQEQAIPATFSYRLITAYLPPVWGWPAMVWLRRHDYL